MVSGWHKIPPLKFCLMLFVLCRPQRPGKVSPVSATTFAFLALRPRKRTILNGSSTYLSSHLRKYSSKIRLCIKWRGQAVIYFKGVRVLNYRHFIFIQAFHFVENLPSLVDILAKFLEPDPWVKQIMATSKLSMIVMMKYDHDYNDQGLLAL